MKTKKVETAKAETVELQIIQDITKDLSVFLDKANVIVLKNEDDRLQASEIVVALKTRLDNLEEARTNLVKPLNDHVKKINAGFKPYTEKIEFALNKMKRSISNYILEQDRIAREKEEAEARKIAEKNAKREAEGKAPIIKVQESIERPSAVARTENGGKTTTRKVWKFEVVDASKVPFDPKYFSLDVSKVKKAVEEGARDIAGVRIYEDVVVGAFKG